LTAAATDPAPAPAPADARAQGGEPCPLCGAPLQPEQEWCLSCGGAARTRLAPAPRWKGFATALAAIVALSLGVLAAALIKLADDGSATAATSTTTITSSAAPGTQAGATQPATTASTSTSTAGAGGSSANGGTPAATTTASSTAATQPGAATTTATSTAGKAPARVKLNPKSKSELDKKIKEDLHKAGVGKLLPGSGGR